MSLAPARDTRAYVFEISDNEIERRKAFLEFGPEDAHAVADLSETAREYVDPVIEELYEHFLAFDETRAFFTDPTTLGHVKAMQRAYFLRLTEGEYGRSYVEDRLRIGTTHERIDLAPRWYLGGYSFYLRAVGRRLVQTATDPRAGFTSFLSLLKLVFLDISLAMDTYIAAREATNRKQQEAIRELSTPVLQIRDRLILLPLIGVIDTERARLITESLLQGIRNSRARVVVMDITGVGTVDSRVANHLIQTITAARLMGAHVIVTGLSPAVSQSLVALGIDLSMVNTVGDLQGGIEEGERLLGYRLVRQEEIGDTAARV